MEALRLGVIGALVSVITVLEQEHGTEQDLVPTQHLLVLEGKYKIFLRFWLEHPKSQNKR